MLIVHRAITASELGIQGDVRLDARLTVATRFITLWVSQAVGRVDNPFEIVGNIKSFAREQGGTTLAISIDHNKERVYNILVNRYGAFSGGDYCMFRID